MSADNEFIQNVRTYVAELYRDIQMEHGLKNFVEDWWTCKTRQCRDDIERVRRTSDAEAVCVIRGSVREKLVWARQQIDGSRYDDSRGIRSDLDKIIQFIARGLEQETSEAGAGGEAGASAVRSGEADAVRRDVQKLERQNRALAESQAEKNVEIAGLKEEKRRLVQERDTLLRVVDNQKRQITVLEQMAGVPRAQPGVRVEALLRELCASA
jgi:hypothetical protein